MSYRPQYKNASGNVVDLPIDAATVNGKTAIVDDDLKNNTTNVDLAKVSAKQLSLEYYDVAADSMKTGKFASNLAPSVDNKFDLGSTTKRWNDVYAENVRASNVIIDYGDDGTYFSALDTNAGQIQLKAPNQKGFADSIIRGGQGDTSLFCTYPSDVSPTLVFGADNTRTSIRYKYTDVFRVDGDNAEIRTADDTPVFRAENGQGLIRIGNDNLNIIGKWKINIIPEYTGETLDTVTVSDYDRVKFGGEEIVRNEDASSYTSKEVYMAIKPANSGGEVVPFAIAKDGMAYYKGDEVANIAMVVNALPHLYRHQIAFSSTASMRSDCFRFEIYSPIPNQITGLSDIALFLFQNGHSAISRAKDGTGFIASSGLIFDWFYVSSDASILYGHDITSNTAVELNDYCVCSVDKVTQIF